MKSISLLLLLLISHAVYAQWADTVETIASGNFSEINPRIDHADLSAPYGIFYSPAAVWVAFEKWSGGSDAIAAVRFLGNTLSWDTNIWTVSPAESHTLKKYPDVTTLHDGTSMIAWQETADSVWNIYCSTCRADTGNWSTPVALTNDSVSNTNVEVRALSDSSFIVLWKRNSAILFSVYKSNSFSPADTLVRTNTDSTDYDFAEHELVYTERSGSGHLIGLVSGVESFSPPVLSAPDTVGSAGDVVAPRFMTYGGIPRAFAFEVRLGARYTAWWSGLPAISGYQPEELAGDTVSDFLNPVFYGPAYVTSNARGGKTTVLSTPLDFYAWEHQSASDTSVVFLGAGTDSAEEGSNPSITGASFPVNFKMSVGFVVWQSDRTGTSHIYSRRFFWTQSGIDASSNRVKSYALEQNYPDPFNPSTTIGYSLPSFSRVTLRVYDVLGRLVATLVDRDEAPGSHAVVFDGSGLASGVYFYRLSGPGVSIVRKMILVK